MTTATFFIGAKIIKRQQTTDNRQQIFLLAKKSETPIAESLKKYKIKYVVLRKITFVFIEDYHKHPVHHRHMCLVCMEHQHLGHST